MLLDRYTVTSFRTASNADREIVAAELMNEIVNMTGSDDVRMTDAMKALAVLSGDEDLFKLAMASRLNVGDFMDALKDIMIERAKAIGRKA